MVSMIIVKFIGAVFKIPLSRMLGVTGMAYFSASYTLFTTIYALTVTGLSTAVAKITAQYSEQQRHNDCREVLKVSKRIFILLGVFGTLLMLLLARQFSVMIKSENSYLAILVMSPAILFSAGMAAYRGYYEGLSNMLPTGISQVVEAVVKLISGIGISYGVFYYAKKCFFENKLFFGQHIASAEDITLVALPYGAAGAMLGITLSTLAGLLYILIRHKYKGDGITKSELADDLKKRTSKDITKSLIKCAVPITLSAVVINLSSLIDLMTISGRLVYAYENNKEYFDGIYGAYIKGGQQMNEYIYGAYTLAITVFNLVPAFTGLFAKSALPNVTCAWVSGNRLRLKTSIEEVIKITSIIAMPAGLGIFVMAKPIVRILYGAQNGVIESVAPILSLLGISAIFIALVGPIFAVLQGMGRVDLPVKFMLVGAVVKVLLNYLLVGIKQININGAAYSTGVCYAIILILCIAAIKRLTNLNLNYLEIFIKPLVAGILCGVTAGIISNLSDTDITAVIAILSAGVVYILSLIVMGSLKNIKNA